VGSEGTSDFDEVARKLIAMYHCSVKSLLSLSTFVCTHPVQTKVINEESKVDARRSQVRSLTESRIGKPVGTVATIFMPQLVVCRITKNGLIPIHPDRGFSPSNFSRRRAATV